MLYSLHNHVYVLPQYLAIIFYHCLILWGPGRPGSPFCWFFLFTCCHLQMPPKRYVRWYFKTNKSQKYCRLDCCLAFFSSSFRATDNQIGTEGARAMAEALKVNRNVHTVDFGSMTPHSKSYFLWCFFGAGSIIKNLSEKHIHIFLQDPTHHILKNGVRI